MRLEVKLTIAGIILIAIAFLLYTEPRTIEKTAVVPVEDYLLDSKFTIDPGYTRYKRFEVPPGAQNPELYIVIDVYRGGNKDINLVVSNAAGQELYSEKIAGYAERTIPLPGPGTYEIQFDNSFSIFTSKYLYAKAILQYKNPIVRTEAVSADSTLALSLMYLGGSLLAVAVIIAIIRTVKLSTKPSDKA